MLLLDLLCLPSSFPVLDFMGLLQFVVFPLLLISNCANTIPSLLVRVFLQCWILLLGHSFVPFPTGRSQLVLGMLLLRLPFCDFLEFPSSAAAVSSSYESCSELPCPGGFLSRPCPPFLCALSSLLLCFLPVCFLLFSCCLSLSPFSVSDALFLFPLLSAVGLRSL